MEKLNHFAGFGVVEAAVCDLELLAEFLDGLVEFGKAFAQLMFLLHVFPCRLDVVVELDEIGLEERFVREQVGVPLDKDNAFLDRLDDSLYLDQEAFEVGLTTFFRSEQCSSLFEIGMQELELVFDVVEVVFHGV